MRNEIVDKVRNSMYALEIENEYKNKTCFSGWVIEKPRINKHGKTGKESTTFVIVQFMRDSKGVAYLNTIFLASYIPQIVEQMKQLKKISFVICDGQLQWNSKSKQVYPHIYDLKIVNELPYILEEELL